MPGTLLEGAVRGGIEKGGRVISVVIVERSAPGGGADHVPYLLLDWTRGYIAIGLASGMGVRAYRDLTRLVRFVRDELKFEGPISLYRAGDPRLGRYRSLPNGIPDEPDPHLFEQAEGKPAEG